MFFKNKSTLQGSESLGRIMWVRFKKNRSAMLGLYTIGFAAIVAVLGYSICPDQTPFANEQKPELHILKPGTRIDFLLIHKNQVVENQGFFSRMLFGEPRECMAIPIYTYTFKGAEIIVEEYTGHHPNRGIHSAFSLAQAVYALEPKCKLHYDSLKQILYFQKFSETHSSFETITELQQKVKSKQLKSRYYLLGSDLLGRDLLSRLIIGTRISLSVGLLSVLIALLIGITLGALAGYYRGVTDTLIMWLINVVWSIPTLLLVIAITLVLGKGVFQVFIAVGLTMWVEVARIVRGQILSLREKEFIEAGKALGFSTGRIIFRHVLPNVMGPVIVIAAGNFASAILMEAGLSFLGIGAQPPVPSWGEMINAHRGYILMDKAYLAFIPGMAIMFLVLAFMLLGNGLRDALDVRSSEKSTLQ